MAISAESARTIERIRALLEIHKDRRDKLTYVANIVGKSQAYVANVSYGVRPRPSNGIRLRGEPGILINGLRHSDKNCRRCGNPARIVAEGLLCIVCTVLELERKGILIIGGGEENGNGR